MMIRYNQYFQQCEPLLEIFTQPTDAIDVTLSVFFGDDFWISWKCLGDIFGISGAYLGDILKLSGGYLWDILSIS